MRKIAGFTLIEMIVIILLLGIVGAVLFSRLSSPSSFNMAAGRDALLATAQAAQQLALGRGDVTLTIEQSGSEWLVNANAGGDVIHSAAFPVNGALLETGGTAPSGNSCANGFDDPIEDFELSFDSRGNAFELSNDGSTQAVSNGVRICVNDTVAFSLCISPGGYPMVGDCDD